MNYLTDRELEVCKYLVKGMSNYEIGKKIYISSHTVKLHITSVLIKLNARNRTHAAYILGKMDLNDELLS